MWARRQIQDQDVSSLVRDARDFALLNGLVLRSNNDPNDNHVRHIPMTLFPVSMPRKLYQECLNIQPTINSLMSSLAQHSNFMEDTLKDIIAVDDFARNLFEINKTVRKEGIAQPIMSCIIRSDYMMDTSSSVQSLRMRQVEVNAIASGMASHSQNVSRMHDFTMKKYRVELETGCTRAQNGSLELVAASLIDVHDNYSRPDSYILFVLEDRSMNFSDHMLIEFAIHKMRPDIRVVRARFRDLVQNAKLGPNKELLVENEKEVGVVYFRYGYDPSNYDFPSAWETRLLLEQSRAIKCPSINFHIAGMKKFQEVLDKSGSLQTFLDHEQAERLANLYCDFWPVDENSPKGRLGYKLGVTKPGNLVLKPQREGGGHNIFGSDITPFLRKIVKSPERCQYILMERINCPTESNWLLLADDNQFEGNSLLKEGEDIVSEIGIFGGILTCGSVVLSNRSAGYLLRSKRSGVEEGGVASGYAGLSSLVLT